jgi:hypothetical protein
MVYAACSADIPVCCFADILVGWALEMAAAWEAQTASRRECLRYGVLADARARFASEPEASRDGLHGGDNIGNVMV